MLSHFCIFLRILHKEVNHFHGYILHDDQTKLDDWTLLHKDDMLCVAQQPIFKQLSFLLKENPNPDITENLTLGEQYLYALLNHSFSQIAFHKIGS